LLPGAFGYHACRVWVIQWGGLPMRTKRVSKFKKYRRQRIRKTILFSVVLPFACIFIGYLITTLIILPAMVK